MLIHQLGGEVADSSDGEGSAGRGPVDGEGDVVLKGGSTKQRTGCYLPTGIAGMAGWRKGYSAGALWGGTCV